MEAWAKEFVDVWRTNRVELAKLMHKAIHDAKLMPISDYSLEDVIQIFDGGLAMMEAELTGTGSDVRDTYMNAVIPGLLAQGQPLSGLIGQASLFAVLLYAFLAPKIQEKHRPQVAWFIANFYGHSNADTVKIGLEVETAT